MLTTQTLHDMTASLLSALTHQVIIIYSRSIVENQIACGLHTSSHPHAGIKVTNCDLEVASDDVLTAENVVWLSI